MFPLWSKLANWSLEMVPYKEFFRACNILPFSCTHLALWRGKVKDARYMQNKKDSRISLASTLFFFQVRDHIFSAPCLLKLQRGPAALFEYQKSLVTQWFFQVLTLFLHPKLIFHGREPTHVFKGCRLTGGLRYIGNYLTTKKVRPI